MKEKIEEKVLVPENVSLEIEGDTISLKGEKGELIRIFKNPNIKIEKKESNLVFLAKKATKREKKMVKTFKSHLKNMIRGVNEGIAYKLKICSGHFPMNVTVEGNKFVVKNFLGEKYPRTLNIKEGVQVKVDGNDVIIESANKEIAGQVAADIEQLTKVKNRDKRIFQDGIYIVEKDGKELK